MGDLISKCAFEEFLKQKDNGADYTIGHFQEWLKKQPTVYDVDKVIEQLEKELDDLSDSGDDWYIADKLNKLIEIVRAGGKEPFPSSGSGRDI